ncbi:MAG: DUF4153 domain-containing protein [Bradyrhizobium sp.]
MIRRVLSAPWRGERGGELRDCTVLQFPENDREFQTQRTSMPARSLAFTRPLIGLLQGGFLYLLYFLVETKSWPAGNLYAVPMMATAGAIVPLLAISGLGNLRPRTLGPWLVAAVLLCCGIAAYGVYRGAAPTDLLFSGGTEWALSVILFIMQSLIMAGDADRRIIASYPRYFDVSWKLGIQVVLALLFLAALWGLLWLGAALFNLIKISLLSELIRKPWFDIPVTTLAVACSLHITDVRANLVTGTRTLTLTLLSWLLPIMTIFAVLFLLALPVVGLDALWATRRATSILLAAVAALVLLINAAYQDGKPEAPIALFLRQSRWLAAIAIVPLVVLAGYGLLLRVEQYGWTPERVVAAACVVVAACYAAGYVFAGASSRLALRQLELTNIATAFIVVVIWLALLSPIADPAKISVADQISRLNAGRIAPDRLDFAFLRFGAGRYGREALQRLAEHAEGPHGSLVAERARRALQAPNRFEMQQSAVVQATPAVRAANIAVIYPVGARLPDSFLQTDWMKARPLWPVPGCLLRDAKCEAVLTDLDGDGRDEILLFELPFGAGVAFQVDDNNHWSVLGMLINSTCRGVREALRAGKFEMVAPPTKDIEAAGQRLSVVTGCK